VTPPAPGVSRLGRALDLLALILVLAGAGAYIVSYLGLDKLRGADIAYSRGMTIQQLAEYDRLELISHLGLAAVIAGIACGVFSWRRERRRSTRERTQDAARE
jgi:hypothetical protein